MSIKISELVSFLDQLYPKNYCLDFDKVGLEINVKTEVKRILVVLEITKEVVLEAIEQKCDLIICHHPFFFKSVDYIDIGDSKGWMTYHLITNNINVFSIHTNADVAKNGLGSLFSSKLKINDSKPLIPTINENIGIGGIGLLNESVSLDEYLMHVKSTFMLKKVRYCDAKNEITRVAFVNGSGASHWKDAHIACADLFICGDLNYHSAQDALQAKMSIIEIPHSCEFIFTNMIKKALESFDNIEVIITKTKQEPIDII